MRGGDETRHHSAMRGYGLEMGGIMMGRRFCSSNEAMAPRVLGRLESSIKPTDAQKPEMDALRAAATKAESIYARLARQRVTMIAPLLRV